MGQFCVKEDDAVDDTAGPGWARNSMVDCTFRENLCDYYIDRDVLDDYIEQKGSLGTTGFDHVSVQAVKSKTNGKLYACKTFRFGNQGVQERRASMASLRTEVELLSSLDHPNIIRPYATYEDVSRNEFHIIMELCRGGDLSSRKYTEREAGRIIYKILNAIVYCHNRQVVHRDIKIENILFEGDDRYAEVKLIDFGMSRRFETGADMTEQIGTVYTVAPEVLQGTYTEKCDMWSIGVVAFIMITGVSPFEGRTEQETVDNLCAARYSWPKDCAASADAREFVYHLLKVDPWRRWTASRALISPFLKKIVLEAAPESPLSRRPSFGIKMVNTLRRYERSKGLRRIALLVNAYTLDPAMLTDLRQTFISMDHNSSGVISKTQLRIALSQVYSRAKAIGKDKMISHPDLQQLEEESKQQENGERTDEINETLGMSEMEFEDLFKAMDHDRKGVISYVEFLGATIEMCGTFTEDRCREIFNKIDVDDTGWITRENIEQLLGTEASHYELEQFITEADIEGNQKISLAEFLTMMGVKESKALAEEKRSIEDLKRSTTVSDVEPLQE